MGNENQASAGCLFGLALGDALAAPTEFVRDVNEITRRWGPNGPQEPDGNPALVTDDTQMALAVGEALVAAGGVYTAEGTEGPLRQAFVAWMVSPDNTRAPGMTCMSACRRLMEPTRAWQKATVLNSKGCGANMRVAPVGLLAGMDEKTRAGLAQFQGALTHGHPTALAASDLTALAVWELAEGHTTPQALPARLREYAREQRTVYHAEWLGPLWEQSAASPEAFIAPGWDECLTVLDDLDLALTRQDRASDPCRQTGAGWVAEEALATGLLCFLLFPDDPVAALRRGAVTSGDSDSIACLAGAFAGAWHGLSAWPADWLNRIEYKGRISALAQSLSPAAK